MTNTEECRRKEVKEAKKAMLEKYVSPTENDTIKNFGDARYMDGFEAGYRKAKGWKDE